MNGWQEHQARHAALAERHGRPEMVDPSAALRLAGKRDAVHPDDAAAFIHRTRESFDAYAESNRENNGYTTYGPVEVSGGFLGVVDMRPGLPRPTDPAAADPVAVLPVPELTPAGLR